MAMSPAHDQSAIPLPQSEVEAIRVRMRAVAERLALPLKAGQRRTSGNVPGSAAGSSIDFQDHRPYVPGDDPRHIDWQAYARSGHYTMKLYREEVRPLVDLVIDVSASMFLGPEKSHRSFELACFCVESAVRSGSSLRLYSTKGPTLKAHESPLVWDRELGPPCDKEDAVPSFHHIPWRAGSLRVIVSDLLFPSAPEHQISLLLASGGRPIILAPFCRSETDPDWLGNTELLDSESGATRDLHFQNDDMRRYAVAYRNHFDLWQTEGRRFGVPVARVPAEGDIVEALSAHALAIGAVELI